METTVSEQRSTAALPKLTAFNLMGLGSTCKVINLRRLMFSHSGRMGEHMAQIDVEQVAGVISWTIATHRSESGLTQEQVAESLGIGNEAVSRME
ncbi:helix-turn-helix domain-containing protein [Paraburkholderia largidicola]|uniref:helix-turn-helix domain-containing protein n=1 Tax=Paraburkholderia largidicola TaxID=3014751 RepID=UPI0031F675B2